MAIAEAFKSRHGIDEEFLAKKETYLEEAKQIISQR